MIERMSNIIYIKHDPARLEPNKKIATGIYPLSFSLPQKRANISSISKNS